MARRIGVIVNGTVVLKPSVLPSVDTSAMVAVGPVASPPPLIVGVSDGGDPNQVYSFKNYQDALRILKGGPILAYIARAFNPSPDKTLSPGASSIQFIRSSSAAKQADCAISATPPPSMSQWVPIWGYPIV